MAWLLYAGTRLRQMAARLGSLSGGAVPANALRDTDGTPIRTPDGHLILVS